MAEKHEKVETRIGTDQWIVREATAIRPEVAKAFDKARDRVRKSNERIYEELQEGRTASAAKGV
jgi:hypothetical protein